ncbi:ankyrin repeat domain-containing protein 27 isoform X3 [Phyllopteryx taeniolatus]|uniref:ankyrin repeat domain-containing protein 27 isoform X3 n=1 Tax=Phyllopteryx taeniolatus TaxID=161469 RepID=UPI002AD29E16|nr:ankyrin repeat domain-containing protein 27 isoform X3 [Phyllopteryx taeniolatus]
MAAYDENIAKNPFFVALEKLRPDLCDRVAQLHGIVLVPCCGSLDGIMVSELHFDSYVLQPVEDGYRTADGREVRIQDRQILLGSRPPPLVSVPILFEETFYNAREESYSILCISGPVEAAEQGPAVATGAPARAPEAVYHLRNLEEVKEFLGPHCHKLDKVIVNFCQAFNEHDRKGLRHHIDSAHGLYTRCLQCVLRDARPKVLAKQEVQMSLLKQAVEVYVHHGIHSLIFNLVGTLEASQDAAFNKMTRSLHDLQHKDVGVKAHFSINLSRAKWELSQLNQQTSPLLKLLCLRRAALTATRTPSSAVSIEAVCADDLLSVILYLLVKMEIPNWMANLSYMKNFCFSQSSKDELSYCLSTLEAAVEFVSLGKLRRALSGCEEVKVNVELASASATPISRLFEHIANGDEAAAERLLSEGESREDALRPCHPLCACDLCDLRLSGKLNDPCAVTARSRDQRGYTPLHVSAVCGQQLPFESFAGIILMCTSYTNNMTVNGQAQLIDLLVSKGASVNGTDYQALTPLHLACQKGHQGVTLLLLHYKADADAQDNNGNTPLHLACTYGHEDCVKALVYYDFQTCCLDLHNDKGDTPLHLASRWGYEGIVQVMLENGASVHALNNSAHTPAHCALNSKVLTLLRSTQEEQHRTNSGSVHASDLSSRRSSTSSASSSPGRERQPERASVRHRQVEKLLRAVADADVQMVHYLLEWADEDEADASSAASLCHPLCQCASCAPAHKARAVPSGALSVTSANVDGVTPLHVSCMYGHAELTTLLVRRGADVNARTDCKATPLHLASQNDHLQVVKFLLECNAKLNKKDQYGNTALIHACLHGNLDTAATLVQSEALVNVRNRQGNTALHCAVRASQRALVEMLLSAGASPHLRNKKHRTPLDTAYQRGGKNVEIVRSLQKALGLSPDDEPIKLLSVPKGTLAHSFVQRLRLNDHPRPKMAASRIQLEVKKTCRSPTRGSAAPEQASPDKRRQRLRCGETADVIGPSAGGTPRRRGRGPARRHTPDSGEGAPEPPIDVRARTRRRHDNNDDAAPATSPSHRRTARTAAAERSSDDERVCRRDDASCVSPPQHDADEPAVRDTPVSSDTSDIDRTNLTRDIPCVRDTSISGVTPDREDTSLRRDTPNSRVAPPIKDAAHAQNRDTPNSSDNARIRDTPISDVAPGIEPSTRHAHFQ